MYFFQCAVATLIIYFALTALSLVSNLIVIASIASTAFTIFASPHHFSAQPRYIFGSYFIGLAVGALCYYLMIFCIQKVAIFPSHYDEIFGALSVGISLFFMVIFDFKHPPASAASLALVLYDWNSWTIVITFLALIILSTSRHLLRRHLIQLI